MTNEDKKELARLIKKAIGAGWNINTTVKRLLGYGFTESTIRKYYKSWNQ